MQRGGREKREERREIYDNVHRRPAINNNIGRPTERDEDLARA